MLRFLVLGTVLSGRAIWKAFTTMRKIVLPEDRMIIHYWFWPSKTIGYDSMEACERGGEVVRSDYGAIRVTGAKIHLKSGPTIVVDRV